MNDFVIGLVFGYILVTVLIGLAQMLWDKFYPSFDDWRDRRRMIADIKRRNGL